MKKFILLFLLVFVISTYSQDFQISNMNGSSVDYPHVAIAGNYANIILGTNFRYFRFDINGISTPIDNPVTPATNYGPNTTDVAVDKNNPNHVAIVYDDYHHDSNTGISFYGSYMVESTDAGVTWDAPTLLDTINYGNSIDNIFYNIPQVKFLSDGSPIALWRVHANSVDTNAIYIGYRFGTRVRVDNPNNSDLELEIGFTLENHNGADWIALSYSKMENFNAKFYFSYSKNGIDASLSTAYLVKNDGQTFLNSFYMTKAFMDDSGAIKYIYTDFAHGPKLIVSTDDGSTWNDVGIVDNSNNFYIAIDRVSPTYYVKLLTNINGNLVYFVSSDLINWQSAGQLNSTGAIIINANSYVDLKIDPVNKFIVSAWIDQRTGDQEIFYGKGNLPDFVGVGEQHEIPNKFTLSQNYPNPFNPSTVINFSLPKSEMVTLRVYNELGEEVATLINKEMNAGFQSVTFNASRLSSGIYFYKLSAGNFTAVKKMILLK